MELCIDRRPQPVSAPPTGRLVGPAVIDLSVHMGTKRFGAAAVQFGSHGLRGLWVSTGVVPVSPAVAKPCMHHACTLHWRRRKLL